jgi:hypothetical protein
MEVLDEPGVIPERDGLTGTKPNQRGAPEIDVRQPMVRQERVRTDREPLVVVDGHNTPAGPAIAQETPQKHRGEA